MCSKKSYPKEVAMSTLYTENATLVQSDTAEISLEEAVLSDLEAYTQDFVGVFPDKRLYRVFADVIRGVLGSRSLLVSQIVAALPRTTQKLWHAAKRVYRFFGSQRYKHQNLLRVQYYKTRQTFVSDRSEYVLLLHDFSNVEKEYSRAPEFLSWLFKKGSRRGQSAKAGQKNTVPGYNLLGSIAVGQDGGKGLTFAKVIAYEGPDFISLNREVWRAIRYSKAILPDKKLRHVADRQWDDQKNFRFIHRQGDEFIIRAYHDRCLETRRPRAKRWKETKFKPLADNIPKRYRWKATLKVKGKRRHVQIRAGYQEVRLPGEDFSMWLVVAHASCFRDPWLLLTNVPVTNAQSLRQICADYARRWGIEDLFRFLKDRGLNFEDTRLRSFEGICRAVAVALIVAFFVLTLQREADCPYRPALLELGGKLGIKQDKDGPYLLLAGLKRVLDALVVRSFKTPPLSRLGLSSGST
jgi:hypothetical protein